MTAYIDSSIVLRLALRQTGYLASFHELDELVTSALTEVECMRSLDRLYRQGLLAESILAERRGLALRLLGTMDRVGITPSVLRRTADPFPTALGTLDGIHLSSALLWSQAQDLPILMCTHDTVLARAARSMGLEVAGV